MRVLVIGASGYVGSRLVAELLARGYEVVVGLRSPTRLRCFGWGDRVQPVRMDVGDPDMVCSALAAAGTVQSCYYLVHDIGQPGYEGLDRNAAHHFADAARRANVRRIVYLGGFVPDARCLSPHLCSRAAVGAALGGAGGVELVWLRAAVIIGAGSVPFEITRYVVDRLPVVPMPEWMDNPVDPISVRDALHYLVAAAEPDRLPAGSYDIRGPDTSTYRDLLFTYLREFRIPRLILTMPRVDLRLAGWVGAHLMPVPTRLTIDLMQSLDYPMQAAENRIRDLVPDPPGGLLGLRHAVHAAVTSPYPVPVTALTDPHHLATSDPAWAGGDRVRAERYLRRGLALSASLAQALPGQVLHFITHILPSVEL